jgi:hypothetical protein
MSRLQMHMLLHLEGLQQGIDMRSYDMKDVTLSTNAARRYLNLEVPGLAEARPSVLRAMRCTCHGLMAVRVARSGRALCTLCAKLR